MKDQEGATEQRPFPKFLDEWRELNGPDFTPSDYISQPAAIPYVIASQWLFRPNFIEYRGGVFRSNHTSPTERATAIYDEWFDTFQGSIADTEFKVNLTVVPDLFAGDLEPYEEDLSGLAHSIAACWRGLLKLQFPDREFVVDVFDDPNEPYDPQITFYSKTEETPATSAVVVYDLAPAQFAPVDGTSVGVHVDLPPSLRDEFAGLARPPARAMEVDVRAIGSIDALLAAIAPGTTTLTDALQRSPTTAILLSRFEQLWVKNRPVAEQFLRELPAALVAVRDGGKPCHVAFADLAGDTVGAVVELLTAASADTTEPVPVFRYPPAA